MGINWAAFEDNAIRGLCTSLGGLITGTIAIGINIGGLFFSDIPQIGPIAGLIIVSLGCCIGFMVGDYFKSRADRGAIARNNSIVVEGISSIVVVVTIVGLVVGIMYPGDATGAVLPLALFFWFILYRWMVQHNY